MKKSNIQTPIGESCGMCDAITPCLCRVSNRDNTYTPTCPSHEVCSPSSCMCRVSKRDDESIVWPIRSLTGKMHHLCNYEVRIKFNPMGGSRVEYSASRQGEWRPIPELTAEFDDIPDRLEFFFEQFTGYLAISPDPLTPEEREFLEFLFWKYEMPAAQRIIDGRHPAVQRAIDARHNDNRNGNIS